MELLDHLKRQEVQFMLWLKTRALSQDCTRTTCQPPSMQDALAPRIFNKINSLIFAIVDSFSRIRTINRSHRTEIWRKFLPCLLTSLSLPVNHPNARIDHWGKTVQRIIPNSASQGRKYLHNKWTSISSKQELRSLPCITREVLNSKLSIATNWTLHNPYSKYRCLLLLTNLEQVVEKRPLRSRTPSLRSQSLGAKYHS